MFRSSDVDALPQVVFPAAAMGQLTGHCHAAGNEAGHLLSMSTPDEAPVDHAVYSEFAIKHIRIMRIIFYHFEIFGS